MASEQFDFLDKKYPDLAGSKPVERASIRAAVEAKRNKAKRAEARPLGARVNAPNTRPERIEAYLERLEAVAAKEGEKGRLSGFERLKSRVIHEYCAQISDPKVLEKLATFLFEEEKKIARVRGQQAEVERIEQQPLAEILPRYEQLAREKYEKQAQSLAAWLDYLYENDAKQSVSFRYFVIRSLRKMGAFDKEKGEYTKRSNATSLHTFPDLNSEALGLVYRWLTTGIGANEYQYNPAIHTEDQKQELERKRKHLTQLIQKQDFASLYAFAQLESAGQLNRESIEGEWRHYPQGSDPALIEADLHGKGTGWCTASGSASSHLKAGDYFIYFTRGAGGTYSEPRIAIRREGEQVVEVRGVQNGSQQGVEPILLDVARAKYTQLPGGDKYEKKDADMRRLTEIEKRMTSGVEPTIADLRFLYELDAPIEGFGYQKDPRIGELLAARNKHADLATVFSCRPDQISLTPEEALKGDIVFHYGDLDLESLTSAEGLVLPQSIGGHLILPRLTSAKGLKFPQSVDGRLDLPNLTSAEGLVLPQSIGGHLILPRLTSAEGLVLSQSIGGGLYLSRLTSAKGLVLPQSIGGDLDLPNLTSAEGLVLPQSIGGYLDLESLTSAEGLVLPQSIGGHLDLHNLTSAKDLKFPESIGGNLDLPNLTSAEGLVLPQSIGGYLDLSRLTSAKDLKFPESIGGDLDLPNLTSAKGLTLPQSVGGRLDLRSLTSAEGLVLPQSIGGYLDLFNLTSAEGLVLPQSIGGNLNLYNLTSAEGLVLPRSIGGGLYLHSLTSAEGLVLPQSIGGDLVLPRLTSAEKAKLRQRFPHLSAKIL